MALAEKLSGATPREGGRPCGIFRISQGMDEEDSQALKDALFAEPRTLSNTQLQELLNSEGYSVSYASISQHRRKLCRCFVGTNPPVGRE